MVAESRALARPRTRAQAPGALHPGAWLAWLIAGCAVVFLTSNPLYLSLGFLVACAVYVSAWDAPKRRSMWPFIALGLLFALLSVPVNTLTGSSGPTVLFTLPELSFPRSFGGVVLGGDITGEALVTATGRALGIATLVMLAAAFNAAVDHARLLRMAPRSLSQVMMLFTIGVLVIPQALRHARAVIEARRLRGRTTRGLSIAAILLPVLQGALERSVQRAESLDARGFGGRGDRAGPVISVLGVMGLGICCWGAFAHFYYGASVASSLAIAAGAGLVVVALVRGGGKQQRLAHDPWRAIDIAVAAAGGLSVLLLLAMRITATGNADYLAYPSVGAPAFHVAGAAAFLLLLAPAFAGALGEST